MTNVFSLADQFVEGMAGLQPVLATQMGLEGHNDRWGDLSPAGWQATSSFLKDISSQLSNLSVTGDHWEALGRRVLREHLSLEQERISRLDPFSDLNNIASPLQVLRDTFDLMPKETAAQWVHIAARLEGLGTAFRGYIASLEEGRRNKRPVAKRQVEACLKQCELHASDHSYFNHLSRQASDVDVASTLMDRILIGVDSAKSSYRHLGEYLETDYLPSAAVKDAVGIERYQFEARRFLGADIDLETTYRWGWEEVRQTLEELRNVGHEIDPTLQISEVASLLKTDLRYVAASRDAFIRVMRERQRDALARLDGEVFDIPPEVREVDVQFAPSGGALGAYYNPPSEDFSRKGTVWYVKQESTNYPLFDEITTGYHEGFPGHHLQCGVQLCLGDRLTRAHRLAIWNEGYGEGWALYAERLMGELGFLERPEYRFGLSASQMMRACRVVIDIGMHLDLAIPLDASFHPGEQWTFETAVALLTDYALLDPAYAQSEVTRYLGFPAQAITYKIGEQRIMDLRAEAERQDWFTLKAFHGRILGSGPVGLDHLCELVLRSKDLESCSS
jgi:uncharacterized protein (DUF885 family)